MNAEAMDDAERASAQETFFRQLAETAARNQPVRDYESEICPGCSYATATNYGRSCDGWKDCLEDLCKRERK